MGKFKLTDNETGKTVVVNGDSAPTEAEAEQIFMDAGLRGGDSVDAAIEKAGNAPLIDTAVDMARAIPGGLAKGAAAIAGLPGDIDRGLTFLADKALGVSGADRQQMDAQRDNIGGVPRVPNSEQIAGAVSSPFGGFYEPKTVPGQYAETAASFAPNAVAPGGALARTMRVAVPGIASEFGGQMTKGTKWEPLGRAVGALGGGIAQGVGEGVMAARGSPAPSGDALKRATTDAYKRAENAGVVIKGDAFKKMADDLSANLTEMGIDADLTPNAARALNRVQAVEGDISLKSAEQLRKVVNKAIAKAAGPDGKEDRALAYVVRDYLDDFVESLDDTKVTAGINPEEASAALKEARSLFSRKAKGEFIDNLLAKAETRAKQFTGSGKENAIRTEFRKVAMNDRAMARFSPAEREAIKKVAEGTMGANVFRRLGSMAPQAIPTNMSLGGAGLGGAIGSAIGGPPGAAIGAIAPSVVGLGSRGIATVLTNRNAKLAAELMRRGGPAVNPGATQIPQSVLLGTLLSQAGR